MEVGNITSPEGLLMLPIALLFDATAFMIFIIEIWFDLGILSTLTGWTGWLIIGAWAYFRGGMSLTDFAKSLYEKGKAGGSKGSPKKISGSGDMKDWQLNKKGAYELKDPNKTENLEEETSPGLTGAIKGFIKRVGLSFVIELIPWLGSIWPGLTIFVWKELKRQTGTSVTQDN